MKVNIIKNPDKKTITVVVAPIIFTFTDYLFTKYDNERFFASGIMQGADYKTDILPFAKGIMDALNGVMEESSEKIVGGDILTLKEDEYRLIGKNLDKDNNWKNQEFKLNLSSKSKTEGKRFLFHDLEMTKPVSKEDAWKYIYAVEMEISAGYNEETFEKYVYTVFHRAVVIGERPDTSIYKANDSAWNGFNFEEETQEDSNAPIKDDSDLPF